MQQLAGTGRMQQLRHGQQSKAACGSSARAAAAAAGAKSSRRRLNRRTALQVLASSKREGALHLGMTWVASSSASAVARTVWYIGSSCTGTAALLLHWSSNSSSGAHVAFTAALLARCIGCSCTAVSICSSDYGQPVGWGNTPS